MAHNWRVPTNIHQCRAEGQLTFQLRPPLLVASGQSELVGPKLSSLLVALSQESLRHLKEK